MLSENRDGSELLEIEVNKLRNAKVGVEFIQWQPFTGRNESVDLGFWNKENCSMEVNCTKNMRGNNVYYLSAVQKLYLTVISTAVPGTNDEELKSAAYSIDFSIKEKTDTVSLHITLTLALLVIFAIAFSFGVEWMRG